MENSCSQWTIFKLVSYWSWCFLEFHSKTAIILSLYQLSTWRLNFSYQTICKLITSLFSVVHNPNKAISVSLNEEFTKISNSAEQWKILFNTEVPKQAQEIVFSHKKSVTNNGTIYFNNMLMVKENVRKHLVVFLDVKTKFFGTHWWLN